MNTLIKTALIKVALVEPALIGLVLIEPALVELASIVFLYGLVCLCAKRRASLIA